MKKENENIRYIPELCILKDGIGGEMYFSCYSSERKSDWLQKYLTEVQEVNWSVEVAVNQNGNPIMVKQYFKEIENT